jgi:hypothetical protein
MTASKLIAVADDLVPEVLGSGSERSRLTRLGLALGRKRGRSFAGLRLPAVQIADATPGRGVPGASCPLLESGAETSNAWTSGDNPQSHKTRSLPIPALSSVPKKVWNSKREADW